MPTSVSVAIVFGRDESVRVSAISNNPRKLNRILVTNEASCIDEKAHL